MNKSSSVIGVILPHQLGKLCLVLRLLRAARVKTWLKDSLLQAYVPDSMIGCVKRLQIFDEVFAYSCTRPFKFDLVMDLTSYDYSYELTSQMRYASLVRRDLDCPWKINHQSSSGRAVIFCPVLTPDIGLFAKDPYASAMLCELPLINLALGYPVEDLSLFWAEKLLGPLKVISDISKRGPTHTQAGVLLLVGGAHSAKRYPSNSWLDIASQLSVSGMRVTALGGPDEKELMPLLSDAGLECLLFEDLSLTMDAILESKLLISNDCGPMHLALMLGKPILGIFGPTIPESWFVSNTVYQRSLQSEEALACKNDVITSETWEAWPPTSDVIRHALDILEKSLKPESIKSVVKTESTSLFVD